MSSCRNSKIHFEILIRFAKDCRLASGFDSDGDNSTTDNTTTDGTGSDTEDENSWDFLAEG